MSSFWLITFTSIATQTLFIHLIFIIEKKDRSVAPSQFFHIKMVVINNNPCLQEPKKYSKSFVKQLNESIRLHNETTTDVTKKLELLDDKNHVIARTYLSAARDSVRGTSISPLLGVMTFESISKNYPGKLDDCYSIIEKRLISACPILEMTDGYWGVRRALTLAFENQRNTLNRKTKREERDSISAEDGSSSGGGAEDSGSTVSRPVNGGEDVGSPMVTRSKRARLA